jgi:DNA-binding GntR family transcriptional regulator
MAQRIVDLAGEKELIGYIEADRQFHLALLALAGNAQLVAIVAELRARTRLLGLEPLAESGELATSAAEHLEMLRLVEVGDRAGLEQLMRRHIGHVRGSWAGRTEEETS